MTKIKIFTLIPAVLLIGILGTYWVNTKNGPTIFSKVSESDIIPPGFSDKAVVYTISSSGEYPKFLKAVIDPEDVRPGDIQKMLIEVESLDGIEQVKAEIEHDEGIDELILSLEDGDEKHGQWFGEWEVHSTHSETYRTTFIAKDNTGKTNKIVLTWTDACVIPIGGNWTLDSNCAISEVNGVDNGAFIVDGGYTLTINTGGVFVWNPGQTITITNGSIAIANGGQLKQTNLWMIDSDGDGYPASDTQYAQDTAPTGGIRRYLVAQTGIDCNDSSNTIYPGAVAGVKDCDVNNYYYTSGTASPTGTNYCKYRDYEDKDKICQIDGTISDPVCDAYADSTVATCGTCKYASGACSSCSNYNTSTSCGTKDCDYLNYYFTYGTASPTGTNYCKYRDYADQTKYCNGAGTCGDPSCSSYADSTVATCGTCKYASGACSSCYKYGSSYSCGKCRVCSSGTCYYQSSREDLFNDCAEGTCPIVLNSGTDKTCNEICGSKSVASGYCNGSGGCGTRSCGCSGIGYDTSATNGRWWAGTVLCVTYGGNCSNVMEWRSVACSGKRIWWTYCRCS